MQPPVTARTMDPYDRRLLASGYDVTVSAEPPGRRAAEETVADEASLDSLEEIYRRHAPRFLRVAAAIVENAETAEDVVQDAFARAIVQRESFRGCGDAVGWLWRIVVNAALSRKRRGRLEIRTLARIRAEPARPSTGDPGDDLVREHVSRLPERQRLALFLRYYADLEYEAIGAVLSIAPGTVGKLLYDARMTIKRALDEGSDG